MRTCRTSTSTCTTPRRAGGTRTHGELEIPEDWDFLPQGDAFLTRTVKSAGAWWQAWLPRTRSRRNRRSVGIWAPAESIAAARYKAAATATADARARRRDQYPAERDRRQAVDAGELEAAIVAFLAFGSDHADLAASIAREAAARATVVSSG